MKYFSEKTKKMYEDVAALETAEKEFDVAHAAELAKKEERANAAKAVEALYKEAADKKKEADDALAEFCKKYGTFHTSITEVPNTKSLFDIFWNNWLF